MSSAFDPHLHTGREGDAHRGDVKDRGHGEMGRGAKDGATSQPAGRSEQSERAPVERGREEGRRGAHPGPGQPGAIEFK
jgi:hypothetical protein